MADKTIFGSHASLSGIAAGAYLGALVIFLCWLAPGQKKMEPTA
jgi:hypothetical protein